MGCAHFPYRYRYTPRRCVSLKARAGMDNPAAEVVPPPVAGVSARPS